MKADRIGRVHSTWRGMGIAATALSIILATWMGARSQLPAGAAPSGPVHDSSKVSAQVETTATMRVVGTYGGETRAVAVAGHYAYLGMGLRLQVVDVADASCPRTVGESPILPGIVQGVFLSGELAFVAVGEGGLQIIDVADPGSPRWIGGMGTLFAQAVQVADGVAFVADDSGGLLLIDVADPSAPHELQSLNMSATDLVVRDGFAYVADSETLWVVNVANAMAPQVQSKLRVDQPIEGIDIVDGLVYLVAGQSFNIIDVADPTSPREASRLSLSFDSEAVRVSAGHAFVAGQFGLYVVDTADPEAPHQLSAFTTEDGLEGLWVDGDQVYVVDGRGSQGMRIIDVSDRRAPRQIGALGSPTTVTGVAVSGHHAYVLHDGGLRVVDIGDPAVLREVGGVDMPGFARDIDLGGNFAFVAAGYPGGLRVVDVSDPAWPHEVSVVSADGSFVPGSIAVSGNLAFLVGNDGLRVYDVARPDQPRQVGALSVDWDPTTIEVRGDHAYVETRTELLILDVSIPSTPRKVGAISHQIREEVTTRHLAVEGHHVYLPDGEHGLRIIDVRDPTTPFQVGLVEAGGTVRCVFVSDMIAYVVISDDHQPMRIGILRAFDVSTPSMPRELGQVELYSPGFGMSIQVSGGYAYVAAANEGLMAVRVELPTSLRPVQYLLFFPEVASFVGAGASLGRP